MLKQALKNAFCIKFFPLAGVAGYYSNKQKDIRQVLSAKSLLQENTKRNLSFKEG
jgi:hypothetical protein